MEGKTDTAQDSEQPPLSTQGRAGETVLGSQVQPREICSPLVPVLIQESASLFHGPWELHSYLDSPKSLPSPS